MRFVLTVKLINQHATVEVSAEIWGRVLVKWGHFVAVIRSPSHPLQKCQKCVPLGHKGWVDRGSYTLNRQEVDGQFSRSF
jgi:hypothetical protein